MPIIVLFIVYSSVKSNIILQDTDFLSLLMNHKGKFIFYFFVSFIEEVIFRGIIFGLLLQKCKNKYLSCVIAALIFTLPHIFNTDNISVLVMFIFPFLYGIFANRCPKGAFYIFINIEKLGMTGQEFAPLLLENAKVAMVPGDVFGTEGDHYIRMSFANSYENIVEGCKRLKEFVEKLRSN